MSEQTVNMAKRRFRIGDLSRKLQVKKFVIRFWEKEFCLQAARSQGGQRYYTQDDFKTFNTIKYLLYNQGYTIAGAKSQLASVLKNIPEKIEVPEVQEKPRQIQAATKTIEKPVPYIPKEFLDKVARVKERLEKLRNNL